MIDNPKTSLAVILLGAVVTTLGFMTHPAVLLAGLIVFIGGADCLLFYHVWKKGDRWPVWTYRALQWGLLHPLCFFLAYGSGIGLPFLIALFCAPQDSVYWFSLGRIPPFRERVLKPKLWTIQFWMFFVWKNLSVLYLVNPFKKEKPYVREAFQMNEQQYRTTAAVGFLISIILSI